MQALMDKLAATAQRWNHNRLRSGPEHDLWLEEIRRIARMICEGELSFDDLVMICSTPHAFLDVVVQALQVLRVDVPSMKEFRACPPYDWRISQATLVGMFACYDTSLRSEYLATYQNLVMATPLGKETAHQVNVMIDKLSNAANSDEKRRFFLNLKIKET